MSNFMVTHIATTKIHRTNVPTPSSWMKYFQRYSTNTISLGISLLAEIGAAFTDPKYRAVHNVTIFIPTHWNKFLDGFTGTHTVTLKIS